MSDVPLFCFIHNIKHILGNFNKNYVPKIAFGHYFRVFTNSLCSASAIRHNLVCFKIICEVFLQRKLKYVYLYQTVSDCSYLIGLHLLSDSDCVIYIIADAISWLREDCINFEVVFCAIHMNRISHSVHCNFVIIC